MLEISANAVKKTAALATEAKACINDNAVGEDAGFVDNVVSDSKRNKCVLAASWTFAKNSTKAVLALAKEAAKAATEAVKQAAIAKAEALEQAARDKAAEVLAQLEEKAREAEEKIRRAKEEAIRAAEDLKREVQQAKENAKRAAKEAARTIARAVFKKRPCRRRRGCNRRLDEGNGTETEGNETAVDIEYEIFINVTDVDPAERGGLLESAKEASVTGLQKALASGSFNKEFASELEAGGLGGFVKIDSNASVAQIISAPTPKIFATLTSRPTPKPTTPMPTPKPTTLKPTPRPTTLMPTPKPKASNNINGVSNVAGPWAVGKNAFIVFVAAICFLACASCICCLANVLYHKRLSTVHTEHVTGTRTATQVKSSESKTSEP
mmetsp:Transcript_28764/g.101872  ORF Transcript_28764/g.101872 Transcript_28764/m.101872 type:complete len:382 (-) Transcript_28764:172-1317(-)